jgi:biopolymer transport protein ExbD
MSPLRLIPAGLATILAAVAMMLWVGCEVRSEPYSEFYGPPEGLVFFVFFAEALCGAGILTILRGFRLAIDKNYPTKRLPRIFPEIKLRNLTAWRGGSVSPSLVMASLNAFSVSWICVLMTLVIIFQIMSPPTQRGLYVDWIKRSHISAIESPWPETMSVYIKQPEALYINGEAVKWDDFERKLRAELGRRAEWTVYVEADNNTAFMGTVHVIDTVQALGGKVVWITPQTRAEWKKQNQASPAR